MRPVITTILFSTLCLPAAAQPVTLTPQQVGQIFCIARLGNDMAPVGGLLTADLAATISAAEARNEEVRRGHPDEKPPLGDGIPWQAFPDYADQCEAGKVTFMMDEARVALDYAFTTYPDAGFTDTLSLRLVEDPLGTRVWRIDDIAYANGANLRAALASAFLD
ncbi:hypothetical protein [Devosia sp.]|uniref:hypothetical protein n=1 Tax=Devosia sp. TaxID=1871048 RepID=UPI001AD012E4|nr:hypothetical protein [Devosia sp.]MBN9310796.1 hypothetical protein [Devosia sp.]